MVIISGIPIPATVAMILVATLGTFCAGLVWFFVLADSNAPIVIPRGFYPFIVSVALQIAAWITCTEFSDEVAQTPVLGITFALLINGCFAVTSFALSLLSWISVRREPGVAARVLRRSSLLLVMIWAFGFLWYLFGE